MRNGNGRSIGGEDQRAAQTSCVDTDIAGAIRFGAKFAASEKFDLIYREGMSLVEKTAAYLDGPGRKEAKSLVAPVTLVYATESMRLTTRLLEIASWLMIYRALKDGEIDANQAAQRRQRVRLNPLGRPQHVKSYNDLPQGLRSLIEASFNLNDRIVQLDRSVTSDKDADEVAPTANPVMSQLAQLEAAFGRRRAS